MAHHNNVHGEPIVPQFISQSGMALEVKGALEDLIEFIGPYTHKVGDVPYITFTQYGVKAEGANRYPDDETRCWTEAEAMWRFRRAFLAYLVEHPARQLAWRCKPTLENGSDGDFIVRCRFALLGKIETPLMAVA